MPPHQAIFARPRVLLTFVGFNDPFAASAVVGGQHEGPVLSLLRARTFDRIVLFSTPRTIEGARATEAAIAERHPQVAVRVRHLALEDPTDYFGILQGIRDEFRSLTEEMPDAEFSIGTASGTPQMHACWVLLAASREIPARLLQMRGTKFVTERKPSLTEIDTTAPEFPSVRTKTWAHAEFEEEAGADLAATVQQLEIVCGHPSMKEVVENAALFARTDVPVLILGESGTGKERIAKLIHQVSERRRGPFVPLNCASIPMDLAESVLFGHVRGAFSGATSDLAGKFRTANNGTLFLDEIATLPLDTQAKLLRALQESVIEPVGSDATVQVNCRIVAATNVDLENAISRGAFREDLFYRINTGRLRLPSLRERRSDIPRLAMILLDEINLDLGKHRQVSPEAISRLHGYDWPGNVRELRNVVQAAAIRATKGIIEPKHLQLATREKSLGHLPEPHEGFNLEAFVNEVRHRLYNRALEMTNGNASQASKLLGCTPQAVAKFRREYI